MQAIILGSSGYASPFIPEYQIRMIEGGRYPRDKDVADLVVFTGGEDINPHTYGDANIKSYYSLNRDPWEKAWYRYALVKNIPMAGICRGMQFFTVMTGGKLIQDVEGHGGGSHSITITKTAKEILVNSLHHQMCAPKIGTYELLAFAKGLSKKHYASQEAHLMYTTSFPLLTTGERIEPEAMWFPKIRALGVQYHPEMMDRTEDGAQFFKEIMHKYIIGGGVCA